MISRFAEMERALSLEDRPKVVIDDHDGRGAALQHKDNRMSCWLTYNYYISYAAAMEGFERLPHSRDQEAAHWRILVHSADC